jgi:pimeloyl-ACP methyl ester carboxylesterase
METHTIIGDTPPGMASDPTVKTVQSGTPGDLGRKTALVTGSVALGALITGAVFRKLRHINLRLPGEVPDALDTEIREMEMMEGIARYYARDGAGVPVVMLHDFHTAASSFEIKPIFEHLAGTTERPLYALDWLGFGRSDRPPVHYLSDLYQRQLRRFLSEYLHQPCDVIATGLACEYAAQIAVALPYLVRRLVLISPTGLSQSARPMPFQRAVVELARGVGAFEIFYYRTTRPQNLRRHYERMFGAGADVPEDLIHYAIKTTQVYGASNAPRYVVEGTLSTFEAARAAYERVRVPSLVLLPEVEARLPRSFDLAPEAIAQNPSHLTTHRLPAGLLPHWEAPEAFFEVVDPFISDL